MKINTHLSIMLLPLFVFVALTSGLLRYHFEKRELFWGAEEEGKGLVVAVSAFLQAYTFDEIKSGKLEKEFSRVFKWGKAEKIILYQKNQPQSYEISPIGAGLQQSLIKPDNDTYVDRIVNFDYSNPDKLYSWKTVKFRDSVYNLGIQSDISDIAPLLSDIKNRIITQTFYVAIFSLLLSLLISSFISGKVRLLSKALKNRQSGRVAEKIEDGIIGELNDLNNTFKTMDSLLQESTENIRSSSVNFSKNCSNIELAEIYNKKFLPQIILKEAVNIKNSEVIVRLVNKHSDCDFFELSQAENRIEIVLGTFRHKSSSELWKLRSAVQTYLKYLLKSKLSFSEIESACLKLFPEIILKGIFIEADASRGERQFFITEYGEGEPPRQINHDSSKEAYFGHNMDSENARITEEYIRNVKDSSIKALSAEISPILRHQQNGVVLLLGAGG